MSFKYLVKRARERGTSAGVDFISDGIDYKGQAQYAYSVSGKGGGVNAKIDPGKLLGMTAAVGFEGSVTRGTQIMVCAVVGPARTDYQVSSGRSAVTRQAEVSRPIVLASMQGIQWEGSAGVSFEVGVSFSAHAGVSRAGASSEAKSDLGKDDGDEDDPTEKAEYIGVAFEAFAGLKAGAAYTYQNAVLEDIKPRTFGTDVRGADKAALRSEVTETFQIDGNREALLRKSAVDFMNQNASVFGAQKATKWAGLRDRSASEITKALLDGAVKCEAQRVAARGELVARAENLAGRLEPYVGGLPQRGLCTLSISSHKPEARAGVEATFEAKAGVGPLATAGVSGKLQGPAISGSSKWSSSRFQTYWPLPDRHLLMFTQDAKLRYWQVDVTAIELSGKVEASVLDVKKTIQKNREAIAQRNVTNVGAERKTFSTEDIKAVGKAGKVAKGLAEGVGLKKVWNSLTYTACAAYWSRPDEDASTGPSVATLPGTGFSIGRSIPLGGLLKLKKAFWDVGEGGFGDYCDPKDIQYATVIAEALHIPARRLSEAIWDKEISSLIGDLSEGEEALRTAIAAGTPKGPKPDESWAVEDLPLLIEVAFRLPPLRVDVATTKSGAKKLDNKLLDKATAEFNSIPTGRLDSCLEALRIRVRMTDLKSETGGFTLGFKICNQELGISYKSIERAGSEGIVDLATYWFGSRQRAGGVAAYEAGVPKVLIFDQ